MAKSLQGDRKAISRQLQGDC
jgi:gas vesicle protein